MISSVMSLSFALLLSTVGSATAQEVNTTDLTGYWESENGVKVFIPLMRDGRMPIVLMNKKPQVLLGDWDWATQSLKVNNTRFQMTGERLVMSNQRVTQTHELQRSTVVHSSNGVWFNENDGELIIAGDGKHTWAIHIPPSQEATIRKAKWKTDTLLRTKLEGRCDIDFGYEPEIFDLIWMLCADYEHDWVRIHTPSPFLTVDWSGTWTSSMGWNLVIDMSGQQFRKVYLESEQRIVDLEASWLGSSQGKSILLERKKDSDAIAMVDPASPNTLLLRIDGTEIKFSR